MRHHTNNHWNQSRLHHSIWYTKPISLRVQLFITMKLAVFCLGNASYWWPNVYWSVAFDASWLHLCSPFELFLLNCLWSLIFIEAFSLIRLATKVTRLYLLSNHCRILYLCLFGRVFVAVFFILSCNFRMALTVQK